MNSAYPQSIAERVFAEIVRYCATQVPASGA